MLDNYAGVVKTSRVMLYQMMNESQTGGHDILEAFQMQHPDWLYYDDPCEELGILLWPNCHYGDLNKRQLPLLERDLAEVQSIEILKKFCQFNHSSKTVQIRARLSQIQMDGINERKAKKQLAGILNGSPLEVTENQGDDFQTETETETETKTILNMESSVELPTPSEAPFIPAIINDDPSKKTLWDRLTKKEKIFFETIIQIVDYFKQVTGKNRTGYHTQGALKLIKYWLKEGYGLEDFQKVIDYKTDLFRKDQKLDWISLDTYTRQDKFEDNLSKALDWSEDQTEKGKDFDPDHFPDLAWVKDSYLGKYIPYSKKYFPEMVQKMNHLTVVQYADFLGKDQTWNDPINITPTHLQRTFIEIHQEADQKGIRVGVILPSRLKAIIKQLITV